MKLNIAPKVSVSLAIFAASSGAALAIANASDKLRKFSLLIVPLFVIAGLALLFAIGTAFLSRDKEDEQRKRQDAVRETILGRGAATKADCMLDGRLTDASATTAICEMHRSGEIVPSQDIGGRTLWRFKTHPHRADLRQHNRG